MTQLQRRYYVVPGLAGQRVEAATIEDIFNKKIVGLSTHPNAKENEKGKLFYCFLLIVSL